MRKSISSFLLVIAMVLTFIMPLQVFSAAQTAPGKVDASTIKVSVVDGNSLKFSWGKAKTGKSVLSTTGYEVEYQVEVLQSNGKYKVSTKWKSLRKGQKNNHVYAATKGNTYRVSLRVRAYNGKVNGVWSAASRSKAKKIVQTIGATKVSYSAFKPTFSQIGSNRSVTMSDYLNTQGCAFDTYSGVDGYNFAMDSVNGGKNGVEVVHFLLNGNKIEQKEHFLFKTAGEKPGAKTKLIGHANDGTIYMNSAGKKYMFVAISGGVEKSSTDSNGKSMKLGYIELDKLKQGKIYGVTIKTNNVKMSSSLAAAQFSGITYVGKDSKKGDVFVLKDGRTFYAARLTFSKGKPVLTFFDSARIEKPTFKLNGKTYDASTQGITYHNGFIYLSYSGEANKALNCRMKIGRISYKDLFSETYNDLRTLQLFETSITKAGGKKLAKHIPEALFFTKLEGKDNMYLSINRGTTAKVASDIDAILKSKQTF